MLRPDNVPEVGWDETLSRFILSRSHIRSSDGTVKPDAFVPHPHEELSVNRDLEATDEETWQAGKDIAAKRGRSLRGRGDALAATYVSQKLKTIAAPTDGNANHVNVTGWPSDKPSQKMIAQEVAAVAKYLAPPEDGD
jgi:hypothetical protein